MGGVTIEGGPLFPILGFITSVLFYAVYLRKKNKSNYLNAFYIAFVFYLFMVFQKTFNPIPLNKIAIENLQNFYSPEKAGPLIILVPFEGLNNLFVDTHDIPKWLFVRQYVLNVLMTIPFGFLLSLIKPNIGMKKIVLVVFLFSLAIEGTQLFMCIVFNANAWQFDISDLITNTLGGLMGYLLCLMTKPLLFRIVSEKEIYKNVEKNE